MFQQAKIARKRPEPKKPNILNRQRTRQLSLDCLDPSTADPIPSVSVTSSPEPIFNKNQLHFALKPENFDPQDSPNERFDFNRSSFDERITVEERDEGGSKSDNEEARTLNFLEYFLFFFLVGKIENLETVKFCED